MRISHDAGQDDLSAVPVQQAVDEGPVKCHHLGNGVQPAGLLLIHHALFAASVLSGKKIGFQIRTVFYYWLPISENQILILQRSMTFLRKNRRNSCVSLSISTAKNISMTFFLAILAYE